MGVSGVTLSDRIGPSLSLSGQKEDTTILSLVAPS